jgi:hypothetical protein
MVGFKVSTEEHLVREKEKNIFYFTRKTQEFHRGYMAFNMSQYGHHLSPYKCLVCVQLPHIHEKASLE